ncbi:MAG: hypothetical protein AAF664_25285, partial [Planctomycetota bacterium]
LSRWRLLLYRTLVCEGCQNRISPKPRMWYHVLSPLLFIALIFWPIHRGWGLENTWFWIVFMASPVAIDTLLIALSPRPWPHNGWRFMSKTQVEAASQSYLDSHDDTKPPNA